MYKIFWDAKVLKDLKHLDKLEAHRIVSKVEVSLSKDPLQGTSLSGFL